MDGKIFWVDLNGIATSIFLVFTPSVGVKHFLVDLDRRHVFVPTPSVGVVHIWVECT